MSIFGESVFKGVKWGYLDDLIISNRSYNNLISLLYKKKKLGCGYAQKDNVKTHRE